MFLLMSEIIHGKRSLVNGYAQLTYILIINSPQGALRTRKRIITCKYIAVSKSRPRREGGRGEGSLLATPSAFELTHDTVSRSGEGRH